MTMLAFPATLSPIDFRGKQFRVVTGKTHPGYSIATFDEEREFQEKHWTIQPGDEVIDAGASYGSYTLTALAMGAERVHAFEPEPTVRADLERNVLANNWDYRCAVRSQGLWDKTETVNMYDYAPHWPKGTITAPFEMMRLDDYIPRYFMKLDWLKMDIEGAEERAIRGGIKSIERFRPRLIIECHTFIDAELPAKIRAMLPGYSFEEVPREPCVMLVGRVA
jgi:FkbM family methyltransferase